MTRSLLQPIRPRRVARNGSPLSAEINDDGATLTPGTRKTLAAIGALWVSFAVTVSASETGPEAPAALAGLGERTR